jgi:alpha-beta hydrolase superfamily lysophospholipase
MAVFRSGHEQDTIGLKKGESPTSFFLTSRGLYLFKHEWEVPQPKGILFICHGYGEHCGRPGYKAFFEFLNKNGLSVYGIDHQGHGRSNGTRGHINSIDEVAMDYIEFVKSIIESKPQAKKLPRFLLGESMGAGVAATIVLLDKEKLFTALLLQSGMFEAHLDPSQPQFLKSLSWVLDSIVPKLAIKSLDAEYMSRNKEAVKRYEEDPLNYHSGMTPHFGVSVMSNNEWLQQKLNEITIPVFVSHGNADKVLEYGNSERLYQKVGSTDKTLHILDGYYHEPWEEPEVEKDLYIPIVKWISKFL